MKPKDERITHAAVKTKCGLILLGRQHADCFHQGENTGLNMSPKALDQGFMTCRGRYVDREEAASIAFLAGQVRGGTFVLCSEDIWSPRHGGFYQYDSVKGYF